MPGCRSFPNAPSQTPVERIYDYPHYFDLSYEYGYEDEIVFFDEMLRRASGGGPARALELAAGSGRVTCPLAARGHQLTALDRDPKMLEALLNRARREQLKIETLQADMRSFQVPRESFDAILVPLGLVTVLWKRPETLELYRLLHGALRRKGLLILPLPAAERLDRVIPHYAEWETRQGEVQTRTRFFYTQRPREEAGVVDYVHEITVLDSGRYRLLADSGILRVYTREYVNFIGSEIPGLEFLGWFEMYNAQRPLPVPPDPLGTAACLFRRA